MDKRVCSFNFHGSYNVGCMASDGVYLWYRLTPQALIYRVTMSQTLAWALKIP